MATGVSRRGGAMTARTARSAGSATPPEHLRHGANVLRALARNLDSLVADEAAAPLDHPSARDAVTLLGWRGEVTSDASRRPSSCPSPPVSGWWTGSRTPDSSPD